MVLISKDTIWIRYMRAHTAHFLLHKTRMADQTRRTQLCRRHLQNKLRDKWLACVAVLDAKLGLPHCARTAMMQGNDYSTVCLLRSLMRHLCSTADDKCNATVVLMVLHDVHGATDRFLQAVFTAEEMAYHLATQTVLHDVHMQREIEARLDTVPLGHVVVVHLAAATALGPEQCQVYKLSQPHHRWKSAPIVYFQQCWFKQMSRMVVRDN